METGPQQPERPLWVKLTLLGMPTRGCALTFCLLSGFVAIVSIAVGLLYVYFFICAAAGALAALAYWLAIRCVDQHGGWSSMRKGLLAWLWVLLAAVGTIGIFAVAVLARFVVFAYYVIPQNGMYPGMPEGTRFFAIRRPYKDSSQVGRGDIVAFLRTDGGQD
jgi:hypothetical protein